MGNLWRFTHDSSAGLGDIMLSAYDRSRDIAKAEKPDAPVYNKDVTDPLQFSLRHVDGSEPDEAGRIARKSCGLEFLDHLVRLLQSNGVDAGRCPHEILRAR